jgi:type VI secretion system secreted protein Hcp
MPVDTFLEFQGGNSFKGESQDDKYKDKIEIMSWSLGVSNAGSGGVGAGSGVSKANFNDMSIQKYVDKSSPNFFISCANGSHIDKAIVHVRKAGEKPQEYLTITMEEVFVSSYNHGGSDGSGLPVENITLNFSKIEFKYSPQKPDGSLDAANPKGWDVKASKNYSA